MRKSCLVQLILLIVVIVVLSLAVRQGIVRDKQAAGPIATPAEPTPTLEPPAPAAVAPAPAPLSAAAAAAPAAALALLSSRPVMMAEGHPVGLAAADGWLYLACQREPGPGVFVARVALADYAVAGQRDLSHASEHQLGGIAAGAGSIWVVLQDATVDDASLLLELDANTLETRRTIAASEALAAVAVAPDGALYASRCAPGALLRLAEDGKVALRAPSPEGICYRDLEHVAGALVGVVSEANVLDVLDPVTLTLLARHALPFTSSRGNPVAGNAVAYDGAHFLFAPDRVANPLIMSYEPRDGALGEVIPLTQP